MPVCRLKTRDEVEALQLAVRWLDRPAYFRVELLAPNALPANRRKSLQRRLSFALSDCGCFLASAALLFIPAGLFLAGGISPWPFWPNAVVYLGITLAGASSAKLISLFLSYRLAHRCIEEILASMSAPANESGFTTRTVAANHGHG